MRDDNMCNGRLVDMMHDRVPWYLQCLQIFNKNIEPDALKYKHFSENIVAVVSLTTKYMAHIPSPTETIRS